MSCYDFLSIILLSFMVIVLLIIDTNLNMMLKSLFATIVLLTLVYQVVKAIGGTKATAANDSVEGVMY